MAGNLGKKKPGYRPPPPPPSAHERAEHAGRVPQPGIQSGPRQTVAPEPTSPAYGMPVYTGGGDYSTDYTAAPEGAAAAPRQHAAALHHQHKEQQQALMELLGPISEVVGVDLDPGDAAIIAEVGQEEGVDPALLTSIYSIETAFGTNMGDPDNPNEGSSAGAIGKMQFMPETWESYGEGGDPFDTADAMRAASRYLKASGYKPGDRAAEESAVYSYNHSTDYVGEVLGRADEFRPYWGQVAEKVGDKGLSKLASTANQGQPFEFTGEPEDVRTASDVIPQGKLNKWLGAGEDPRVNMLNPVFAKHLIRAAAKSGDPLAVTSPYRSAQEQGEIDPGTNPAAPPGLSVHQFGGAADIEPTEEQIGLLEDEGIEYGSAGGEPDPPHSEFTDPRLIKRMTKFGPVRSGYAPTDVPLAEGDLTDWSYSGGYGSVTAPSTSTLASYGGVSPASTSGSPSVLDAALNKTAPVETSPYDQSGLGEVLDFLDAPAPDVTDPTSIVDEETDPLRLALKRKYGAAFA